MKEKLHIRKAKIEDFEDIHKLMIQVHQLHVTERNDIYKDTEPIDKNELQEELSKEETKYLVAEWENRIVGICFSKIKEISHHKMMKDRKILHIETICVDKKYKRQGIGTKLYKEISKIAIENKVDSIELMVWGFNEEAIHFYEKLGMQIKNLKFEKNV